MIPTLINMVAAFTSVGVVSLSVCTITHPLPPVDRQINGSLDCFLQGTVLCDIILLNFLKGAEQYKAKKFEEVSCVAGSLSVCDWLIDSGAVFRCRTGRSTRRPMASTARSCLCGTATAA